MAYGAVNAGEGALAAALAWRGVAGRGDAGGP